MDIKEELVEILTVQIALDDKLHKIQAIQTKLRKRIDELRKEVSDKDDYCPACYRGLQ